MVKKQVIDIDFYVHNNLPYPLQKEAEKQGIEIKKGLMAVRTVVNSPHSYEFIMIGTTSADLKNFFRDLATEDGVDLNEVAQNIMKQV